MLIGFQEQVPIAKSKVQVCPSPHASRKMQWQMVQAGANHTTVFRLKERTTGPVCPWLNGTWLSFMNPDLIYPCNTEFITSLAGMCIWREWISTVSICFSNPFSQQRTLVIPEQKQRWQKILWAILQREIISYCVLFKKVWQKVYPKKLLCLLSYASC